MPLKFWDEAFLTAAYLINRVPSRTIKGTTPLEHLFHHKLDYLSKSLGVPVGPIFVPITHINSNSVQNSVSFLDTVLCIKGTSV
jgi:hypothetical protein